MRPRAFILGSIFVATLGMAIGAAMAAESMSDGRAKQLQEKILSARKAYGENSMQHLAAMGESLNQMAASKDVIAFRALAQDLIQRMEKVFPERHPALVEPLVMLSKSYLATQEYETALHWLEKAYASLSWDRYSRQRDEPDPRYLAVTEHELGRTYMKLNQLRAAENMLERCVKRYLYKTTADDPRVLASAYQLLSGVQYQLGKVDEAVYSEEESLAVLLRWSNASKLDIAERQINILQLRALTLPLPQRLQANIDALQLADSVFPPTAEPVAIAVSTAASTYHALGRYAEALPLKRRALSIAETIGGPESVQSSEALFELSQTLGAMGDRRGEFDALMRAKGNVERRPPPDEMLSAKLYLSLAATVLPAHWSKLMGDASAQPLMEIRDAIAYAEKGVAITERHRPVGHLHRQAARAMLGMTRFVAGDSAGSITDLKEALIGEVSSAEGKELRAKVASMLAINFGMMGQGDLSILWGKEAVNAKQALRHGASNLGGTGCSVCDQDRFPYQLLSALLVAQGRLEEAQQVIQMSREYELDITVRSEKDDPRSMRVDLTDKESRALAAYAKAEKQVATLIAEQNALLGKQATGTLNDAEQLRLNKLLTSLVPSAIGEGKRVLRQLETDFAKGKQAQPTGKIDAAAKDNSAIRRAVDRANEAWPKLSTVGVQYVLDKDRLTIILTPPRAPQQAYQRPIDRMALYRQIQEALLLVQSPESSSAARSVPLKQLYTTLIGPIEGALKIYGAKSLYLSLAPELRSLPFAALMKAEGSYLIDDYALALFNEAAERVGQSATLRDAGYRVAAMGATDVGNSLPKLPAVPQELAAVVSAEGIAGDQFLDKAFTRKRLQAELGPVNSSGHNLLHIASHFVLKPGRPNDSVLHFGDGSTLSLAELVADRLDFSAFKLVTYSACQTAISAGQMSDGREMESLSVRTQRQGAKAVMATLWRVSDKSSFNAMKEIYSNIGGSSAPFYESLRKAQIKLKNEQLPPYQWAAYVISTN